MKKKEYQRIGIDENDIKKFVKIFSKKKDIGCIIALSVIAAVVLGILIFLVSNFGFKIVFLIFILLPVILWLWEEFFWIKSDCTDGGDYSLRCELFTKFLKDVIYE